MRLLLDRRAEEERRLDARAAAHAVFSSRRKRGGDGFDVVELWPSLRPPPPTPEELRRRFLSSMIALGADVPEHILHPKKDPTHG